MPLQQTSGNVTADAYGGGVAVEPVYVESIFSTYLYNGTGANQTITNGIDLAGKGGLVWIKQRDTSGNHLLMTTDGGPTKRLRSNGQPSYVTSSAGSDFSSFNLNGFSLGVNQQSDINTAAQTYVSWSLRKQPKFFDVVTYTGNGVAGRTVAHNLGSVPGCIIIGCTTALGTDWAVYHNSLANTEYLTLNSTAAKATSTTYWNSTTPTASVFSLGTDATVNYNTGTYVAYLFAHDAGGFGLTGTDNVVSCGAFTTDANGTVPATTLGYEPQWVMFKAASVTGAWTMNDTMRGQPTPTSPGFSAPDAALYANNASAESQADNLFPTSTGFKGVANALVPDATYIYIAIRRGPMKVPTDATKVFLPTAQADQNLITTNFVVDSFWDALRTGNANNTIVASRLTGNSASLTTSSTAAESAVLLSSSVTWQSNVGYTPFVFGSNVNALQYAFRRAPSFFDEVCYTGTGSNATIPHNLTVAPEFYIVKSRSSVYDWWCYHSALGNTQGIKLNTTAAAIVDNVWNNTSPTSSNFYIANNGYTSQVNQTYVAYLFATCPGVSKVGSYTGNGTTQTINCGFTAGARFVLIKRTDSTGGWYTYDTARGMTTLTDPYLLLNSTAAETATLGSVTTVATGFALNSAVLAAINVSGGTYIFLAIA